MSLKEELVLEAEELGQMHGDTNTSQSSAIRGRKRSAVWKDFEEVTLKNGTVKVQCKYCKFQYSKQADGSTTTLKKHLTRCLKKVRSQTLGQQTLVFTHYAMDPSQDQRAMSDAIEGMDSREVGGQLISVEKAQLKEGSYGDGNYGKRCYNCGEPGHLARDCYNSGECYMGDRSAVHSSCINCGEPGHLAQDCYCSSKRCIDDRSGGSSHGNKDQVDNGDSSIAASVSLPILPKIEDIFNEARRKAMKTMVDSIRLASGKSLADLPADLEKTFLLLEKLEVPTEDLRRDINKLVSGAKQIENLKHETAALAETREKRIQEAKEKASNARKEHKNSLGALKKLQCTLDNKVGYHSELKKDIVVIKGCLSKLEAKEQDLIDEVAEVEAAVAKGSQKAKETATAESEAEAAMDKIVQTGIDEESRTQRELIERLEKCLSHTKANFVTRYGSE